MKVAFVDDDERFVGVQRYCALHQERSLLAQDDQLVRVSLMPRRSLIRIQFPVCGAADQTA